MSGERARVRVIDDLHHITGCGDLTRGAELPMDSDTAAALVLAGPAIELSVR